MTLPPDPEPEEHLRDRVIRRDLVLHIRWRDDSVSRLTTAFGGLRLPADAIEAVEGAFYACAPFIQDLPAFRSLMNGVADLVGLTISGVGGALAALTAERSDLADGAIVNVGKVYWDADWRMIGRARWGFAGLGGEVKDERKGGRISTSGDVQPFQRSIEFAISSQLAARSRAYSGYWSAPQHKVDHPDDEMFSQINKINLGYNENWPRF